MTEIEISDTDTVSEPSSDDGQPKKKRVRFNEEDDTKVYERDSSEYKLMHEKDMKNMRHTQINVKMKYKEFFPMRKQKLDRYLYDRNWKREKREQSLQRLKDLVNVHLRVQKLNRGDDEPLTPEESALPGVTLEEFPHEPTGFNQPGSDYSEEQSKILADLRNSEFLIFSTSLKKYMKIGINEHCVTKVFDDDSHDDFDIRECACCQAKIFIGDWPDHVKSYFHQIMFKYRLKMLAFCWAGNKQAKPHRVDECEQCQKRQKELRENQEIRTLDDMLVYNPVEDPDYQAYLERNKAVSNPGSSDRYSCEPCGKFNLSKEYFDCHLTGRKHKYRMMEIRREKKKGEKLSKAEHVKKGLKRKAEDEEKKALTFGNFFKFLKSSTSAPEPESGGDEGEPEAAPVPVEKKKHLLKKMRLQMLSLTLASFMTIAHILVEYVTSL